MAEQRNLGMTILGIVAIIAVVGLVLLFTKVGATGEVANRVDTGRSSSGIVSGEQACKSKTFSQTGTGGEPTGNTRGDLVECTIPGTPGATFWVSTRKPYQ